MMSNLQEKLSNENTIIKFGYICTIKTMENAFSLGKECPKNNSTIYVSFRC